MAYPTYIAHLDARIREELVVPSHVAPVEWFEETVVTWNGEERYVRAERTPDDRIEVVFQVAGEDFPDDRFSDDLHAPDLASTAKKIAQFLNEAELRVEIVDPA